MLALLVPVALRGTVVLVSVGLLSVVLRASGVVLQDVPLVDCCFRPASPLRWGEERWEEEHDADGQPGEEEKRSEEDGKGTPDWGAMKRTNLPL